MIEIDTKLLPPETLDNLISHFVLRESTDYGEVEVSFEEKKQQLRSLLEQGKLTLLYDSKTNQCEFVVEARSKF